jgi:hypothetical protein
VAEASRRSNGKVGGKHRPCGQRDGAHKGILAALSCLEAFGVGLLGLFCTRFRAKERRSPTKRRPRNLVRRNFTRNRMYRDAPAQQVF